jgi:hypothetical protein
MSDIGALYSELNDAASTAHHRLGRLANNQGTLNSAQASIEAIIGPAVSPSGSFC